uniref:Uncharacterized protein n=1 Tax=Arundo donax TaxID=35708 RepID=A0A0A9AI52_ARUDO
MIIFWQKRTKEIILMVFIR